jgi:hypothetical protein
MAVPTGGKETLDIWEIGIQFWLQLQANLQLTVGNLAAAIFFTFCHQIHLGLYHTMFT